MKLRKSWIWYLAGLLLAIVAGLIAVFALRQAVPPPEPVAPATQLVIVARSPLGARQVVPLEQLTTKSLLLSDVPSGAIFRVEDAAGKFTLQAVGEGQPVLAQNLVALSGGSGGIISGTSQLASLLPEDKVGIVLPTGGDLLIQSGAVSTGDRIDILASLIVASSTEDKGGQVTFPPLQNVLVVKVLQETVPDNSQKAGKLLGVVVALDLQDAVTLKYFQDAGANLSIVLRPPKLTSIFDVIPVTINYIADRFGLQPPEMLP